MFPMRDLKQMQTLLQTYCFESAVTCTEAEEQNAVVKRMALDSQASHMDVGWVPGSYYCVAAEHSWPWLQDLIRQWHSTTPDTEFLELLNSARRMRPSNASERARGCTDLVKLTGKENKEQRGKMKFHAGTPHPNDRGGFTFFFLDNAALVVTTVAVMTLLLN